MLRFNVQFQTISPTSSTPPAAPGFPRGVIITHREVMANLRAISHDGIKLRPGDRCVSWLPFYHDMDPN